MTKGLFITFEGADGCGKTTQIELLDKYLRKKGKETLLTREPGAKGLGVKLREILLNYDGEVSPQCESFLFLADRAQHIDCIIKPALKEGKIILCDRHTDSTVAYQGYARKGDIDKINLLNNIATKGLLPDITFLFDIDVEIAQARVGKEKDRLEKESIDFHNRVREGYLEIARKNDRVKVIDSSKDIESIFEEVKKQIDKLL